MNPQTTRQFLADESGDSAPGAGTVSVALAYPNRYGVGMASLGFLLVRQALRDEGLRVERAFHDDWGAATLESGRALAGFDLLAFSVAYELDYLHILQMMEAAGAPIWAEKRGAGWPLVAVGGVAALVNRHPLYPFVDVLLHGESEAILPGFTSRLRENPGFRDNAEERRAVLRKLDGLPGVEITDGARVAAGMDAGERPRLFAGREPRGWGDTPPLPPIEPARVADLTGFPLASRLVTPRAELGRRVLAELSRGCAHRCAFCWVGHNCRDHAPRAAGEILAQCEEAFGRTGCDSVGLIAACVGAHPEIDFICEELLRRERRISFSSLRAEELRPVMLEALARSGQRGLTLAPEVGGEARRRRLAKAVGDDAFLDAVDRSQVAGLPDVKLYFMTGLPDETDEDALDIVEFTDRIRRVMLSRGRERGSLGALSVNLGVFVPKPGAPLGWRGTPDWAVVRKRVGVLTKRLARLPNTRVAAPSVDLAVAQHVLSNGGFESAAFLLEVFKDQGNWRPAARARARGK